jgi:hypothetical protein
VARHIFGIEKICLSSHLSESLRRAVATRENSSVVLQNGLSCTECTCFLEYTTQETFAINCHIACKQTVKEDTEKKLSRNENVYFWLQHTQFPSAQRQTPDVAGHRRIFSHHILHFSTVLCGNAKRPLTLRKRQAVHTWKHSIDPKEKKLQEAWELLSESLLNGSSKIPNLTAEVNM